MKSFDTKPDELILQQPGRVSTEPEDAEPPTAIVKAESEDLQAEASSVSASIEAETEVTEIDEVTPSPAVEPEEEEFFAGDADEELDTTLLQSTTPPRWFSRERLVGWSPYGIVILLGAILRFWQLGAKPLHHDESLHAYFSLGLLHNLQNWSWCIGQNNPPANYSCYTYNPLLHGPFQFHAIALVYQVSQWLGAPDNGVNTTTVRIAAALLGTGILFLPYLMRGYLGKVGAWLATFFLAVSPSMVYFSRFAREDIYMAFFTLLMVMATGRYIRERKMRWILLAVAGLALSYATSEATFLTIAVFGSFLGALVVWEIGSKFALNNPDAPAPQVNSRLIPRTFGPIAVALYFVVLGVIAKLFFPTLDNISAFINSNLTVANADLANLENITLEIIPWLGILLGLYVFSILAREVYGKLPPEGSRRGLARFVSRRQPVLDSILTMQWTHWFFAIILGWGIFMFLFTVVFTDIRGGIGNGIWDGLYYWLEQQQVARGGQPWYYYIMLIPLYEQVGLIFGAVGIVRALFRPNRFRLFMVYWFLGDFFLYSWAGEKMPWLMIFMTMPMLILAAIGLEPAVLACYEAIKERFLHHEAAPVASTNVEEVDSENDAEELATPVPAPREQAPATRGAGYRRISTPRLALGIFGVVMALLLLIPTLHNMIEVTYVEPADGPNEMMIYVQTTNDINAVMNRIDEINQKDFHGNHQMRIGVTDNATWPFAWYLRDYPNLCFGYPNACPSWKNTVPVVLSADGDIPSDLPVTTSQGNYLSHQYVMRSWWDQGYMLPACPPGTKPNLTCSDPTLGSGVGPGLWLSYGDNPPVGATFNLGLAIQRIWNWEWNRTAFGATNGGYGMQLFIQKGLGVTP